MKLSRVNTLLLITIIGVNAYVMALPVMPAVVFWYKAHHSNTAAQLSQQLHPLNTKTKTAAPAPAGEDRIVIPAMQLEQPIYEGKDARTLNKGLWLRPATSTPDKGGNTVIAGHRFTYTNPRGTLYFLDKVHPGDEIGVFWHGKKYLYRVAATTIVPPSATQVESATNTSQLTLYTCTPLWNPKDRLVVTAILEKEKQL
ncbi:MAG: class D sortase [Candidatus Saccharimonadales bacterium]